MAIGEKATAAGIPLVSGAAMANDLDDIENETRDYIGEVMTTRARSTVSATAPTSPEVGDLWFEPI